MNRRIFRLAVVLCVAFGVTAHAQMSKSVALLKGEVTLPDGSKASNVPVSIFKGTEKTTSTKTNPDGKFTTILQPNATYRVAVNSNEYMYHEENVTVPALDSYKEIPLRMVLTPLKDGPYELPIPVFLPKSSTMTMESVPVLDRLADEMHHNSRLSIAVTVYPDAPVKSKKDAAQQKLAASRETAMRSYFMSKSIPASRFTVTSQTSSVPAGRFPPPPSSLVLAPPAAKGKKKKGAAPPPDLGLIPQYVEVVTHLGS